MKNLRFVFSAAFLLFSITSAASPGFDCSTVNVEGLSISGDPGRLIGEVSWDCFHGGGICTQTSIVQPVRLPNRDLIFRGPYFQLTIHTSAAPSKNGYKAHIVARDMTDPRTAGRGFSIDEFVFCRPTR